jgi:hypothetical protein
MASWGGVESAVEVFFVFWFEVSKLVLVCSYLVEVRCVRVSAFFFFLARSLDGL